MLAKGHLLLVSRGEGESLYDFNNKTLPNGNNRKLLRMYNLSILLCCLHSVRRRSAGHCKVPSISHDPPPSFGLVPNPGPLKLAHQKGAPLLMRCERRHSLSTRQAQLVIA